MGDILANGAVTLGLLRAAEFGWLVAVPIFGIGIAAFILYNAWQIAAGAFDMLIDRELPDDERSRIGAPIRAHPEVRGIHELRTRPSGPQRFIPCRTGLESTPTPMHPQPIPAAPEPDPRSPPPRAQPHTT